MARWLLNIETSCVDSTKERGFNEWYDKVHLPDMLEIPEVLRASRYENTNPSEGQGKYMSMYEIEADDIRQIMAVLGERIETWKTQGRWSGLSETTGFRIYKQITAPVEKVKRK